MNTSPRPQPRSRATLRVYPNPYLSYDKDGRLNGAVRYDPDHGRVGEIHHIGATVTRTVVEERGKPVVISDPSGRPAYSALPVVGDLRAVEVKHHLVPKGLPHTDYHVRMLRDGALLPEDEPTARIADVPFVPIRKALAAAKVALEHYWAAEHPDEPCPAWPSVDDLLGPETPASGAPSAPAKSPPAMPASTNPNTAPAKPASKKAPEAPGGDA